MYDIEVRDSGSKGVTIELRGEFDLYAVGELRETFGNILSLRKPTVVDLSGIAFLDIQCSRELAIVSQLYAHHLILIDPSWHVRASVRACGLTEQVHFKNFEGFHDFYKGPGKGGSCNTPYLEIFRNTDEHYENQPLENQG